jgi:hypothetical protein
MSLAIAERQLARLNVLHAAKQVYPGGTVVTREEGVKLARRSTLAAKEEAEKEAISKKNPKQSSKDTRSNLTGTALEKSTSKTIVMLRAKQNKIVNVKAALDNYRRDTVPEAALQAEMPGVRKIAGSTFQKGKVKTAQALKAERNARLGTASRKTSATTKK